MVNVTTPVVQGSKESTPREVLAFLQDVTQLDVTKYESTLIGTMLSYPEELANISLTSGKYTLKSETSELDVLFKFTNNTLTWVLIRVMDGSPIFSAQQHANDIDKAKTILSNYKAFSSDNSLQTMSDILDTVDATKSLTTVMNNTKLQVDKSSSSTSFAWRYSIDGADYSRLDIKFKDGHFYEFRDDRSYYRIGGTDVNITEEEAVNMALDHAKNFSWIFDGKKVTDFNIVEKNIGAELLTRSRAPLELYPYWMVTLPLDNYYPGNVASILVTIWADNKEIIDCFTLSYGGEIVNSATTHLYPEENTTLIEPSSSVATADKNLQSEHDDQINQIIVVLVFVMLLVGVGITLKKYSSKNY